MVIMYRYFEIVLMHCKVSLNRLSIIAQGGIYRMSVEKINLSSL